MLSVPLAYGKSRLNKAVLRMRACKPGFSVIDVWQNKDLCMEDLCMEDLCMEDLCWKALSTDERQILQPVISIGDVPVRVKYSRRDQINNQSINQSIQ